MKHHQRGFRLWTIALALLGLILCLGLSNLGQGDPLGTSPAIAQIISPSEVWRQVYQKIPDFPLENQYVSKETGKVASDNTLASRFIRYHLYVKRRPPMYRLDWKLTLADYLGQNQKIDELGYPSADTLKTNPFEGDRQVIERLNRTQRDRLVEVLVGIFTPNRSSQTN